MTADTYSSTLGWLVMGTGNDNNSWGGNANSAVFQIFEDAIANVLTESVTGGTLDLSGSPPPAAASQVHYAAILVNGSLSSNQIIKVPNLTKFWWVNNETSGAFSLSLQTPSGTGALLTLGSVAGGSLYSNGTYNNVPLTGGSGFGATANITVSANVVTNVTLVKGGKGYLATDSLSASAANIGGTGSGFTVASGTVGNLIPQNSGWQLVLCDGSGDIVVTPFNSQQIQMPDGSASAPAYSDVNETNSGLYRNGPQDWRLSINGTDVVQITGAGAATPSVFNVLSPMSFQIAGVQPLPSGVVVPYDGIVAPNGWMFTYGQAVSRPIANGGSVNTYLGLWNAITATVVGNTNGNTAITGLTTDMRGIGLNGSLVEATGVPGGTTITFTGATTATLSQAATGSHVGLTLRILPFGQGDGSTTFNVRDGRGVSLSGRDDMSGTARGVLGTITTDSGPLVGTQLNAGPETVTSGKTQGYAGSDTHVLVLPETPSFSYTPSGNCTVNYFNTNQVYGGNLAGASGYTPLGSGPNNAGFAPLTVSFSGTPATLGGSNSAMSLMSPTGVSNFIIKL